MKDIHKLFVARFSHHLIGDKEKLDMGGAVCNPTIRTLSWGYWILQSQVLEMGCLSDGWFYILYSSM